MFFSTDKVSVGFKSGFPVILLPLPSRREQCEFVLRPLTHTVKDFLENIQKEDKGIERATVYNVDGSRISGSTGVDVLLQSDFKVVLNDNSYFVSVPDESKCYLDTLRINNVGLAILTIKPFFCVQGNILLYIYSSENCSTSTVFGTVLQ